MSKRIFDLLFSFIMIVLLIPVFIVIAVLVKCSSPGPMVFRQKRIGQYEVPFCIFKFRTMLVGSGEPLDRVLPGDPRVTAVGRILRFTRSDELPQLVNILRGEMSLVGPRPHTPELAQHLARTIPYYGQRFKVKPGLTGLSQFRREIIGSLSSQRGIRLDIIYLQRRNLWLDLRIIFGTLGAIAQKVSRALAAHVYW